MSVDTYLYVDPKNFEVWMCIASCICTHKKHCLKCQKSSLIKKCKNLTEAIKVAGDYDFANPMNVEYGLNTRLWCK